MKTASKSKYHLSHRSLREIGLILCFAGFVGSFLIGSLLTFVSWMISAGIIGRELHDLGTVMLFLMIPLLVIGGYFLDSMDRAKSDQNNHKY